MCTAGFGYGVLKIGFSSLWSVTIMPRADITWSAHSCCHRCWQRTPRYESSHETSSVRRAVISTLVRALSSSPGSRGLRRWHVIVSVPVTLTAPQFPHKLEQTHTVQLCTCALLINCFILELFASPDMNDFPLTLFSLGLKCSTYLYQYQFFFRAFKYKGPFSFSTFDVGNC